MTAPSTPSEHARRAQRLAADPLASAWVAANAGTGKTQVLTDRVLRLLLAGTRPERILALTYTKAAAAEMSKRVFDRLSSWVTMNDSDLDRLLTDLTDRAPTAEERTRARQLFAAAIETPGGLKVQTIHAFCERLLQRFPLEAGVPPGFSIIDERTQSDLLLQAIDAVLSLAATTPGTTLGRALLTIVTYAVDDQFDSLMRDALASRAWLAAMTDVDLRQAEATYRTMFGIPPDATRATLVEAALTSLDLGEARRVHDVLAVGSTNEIKYADWLKSYLDAGSDDDRLRRLRDVFLTKDNTPRKPLVTKATLADHPTMLDDLVEARTRFVEADDACRALDLIDATLALATIAGAVMARYSSAKLSRAMLDFDDLIAKSEDLLKQRVADTSTAEWVLFKLDGGLDHILVDEAQDTSRQQWSMIEALAAEFHAGGSRDDLVRTLFAVGDEKQSIYGFQGAAPAMFAGMGEAFARQAIAAGQTWRRVPLNVSFRTTAPVLAAVDRVFADRTRAPGLTASDDRIEHIAHRATQAGLVEVWPIEGPSAVAPSDAWAPLDELTTASPVVRLADRIADTIQGWLVMGETLVSEDRPVRAGDIVILVAKRRPFAPAMVAALKLRGIPVAGADRLRLTDQIGVEDLIALGDFLVLPEDDLTLATLLKSPLFGLDDDALITIAPERKGTLWQALLKRAETDQLFQEAASRLKAWRSEADFLPPYEFYASLLERENGLMRRRLLERLGAEAADPIDEFLSLALVFDAQEPPSLQGFLTWLRASDPEIKRDMDQGRDEVRVMTVHGAKGLEAPIVFLPDTCRTKAGRGSSLVRADETIRYWPVKGTSALQPVKSAKALEKDREDHEANRLLYVALTRPRDRLYIAGFTNTEAKKLPATCWYRLVDEQLRPVLKEMSTVRGPVLRFEQAQAGPHERPKHNVAAATAASARPAWALVPAPREATLSVPLAPSRLVPLEVDDTGEPIERPREAFTAPPVLPPTLSSDTRRFLRGTLTHALLEHLPLFPLAARAGAAKAFLDVRGKDLPTKARKSIADEALAILTHPRFAALFGPDSQAEVPLVAEIPRPRGDGPPLRIFGQIDRLAREGDVVRLIDYKTNRPPPTDAADVAEAYLLQLAAYRLALQRIFPDCRIECAILWTDGARLMEIDADMIDGAETRLWQLDVARTPASRQ